MSEVKFLDLKKVNARYGDELREAADRVINSGWYLQGDESRLFESEYAGFIGHKHCIGCGNGLDALTLIYRAYIELGMLKPGDEVIVPANTFIASILALTENGLVPVLVEPDYYTLQIDGQRIEEALTERTKSILIVHLYGRAAYTEWIGEICSRHGLLLVEDNAQAHGCRPRHITRLRTGGIGHAAGHSFYPGKNLGAMGDAGAVTTDDDRLAEMVRTLANYGSRQKYVFDYCGRNSRLDELQAAVLRVKLRHLDEDNGVRQEIAGFYYDIIDNPYVTLPSRAPNVSNVYHIFPVLCDERDRLQEHLRKCGVQTLIHYPVPPHKQVCYKGWRDLSLPVTELIHSRELSLPISPAMTYAEVMQVIEAVNSFSPRS